MTSSKNRTLLVPPILDNYLEAFRFLPIWYLALLKQEGSKKKDKQSRLCRLGELSYQMVLRVAEFLGSSLSFKTQQTWGGSGSKWGHANGLEIIERPRLSSNLEGLEVFLEIRVGDTSIPANKLSNAQWKTLDGTLVISNETGATRSGKPENLTIKFDEEKSMMGFRNHGLVFRGTAQFPREGPIGYYGRLRTFDPKTKEETTGGPVQTYYGV